MVAYAGLGGGLFLEVNTHGGSTVFKCLSMWSNHEMSSRDSLDICIKALGGYFSISKRYVANKHNDNQRLAAVATRLSVRL